MRSPRTPSSGRRAPRIRVIIARCCAYAWRWRPRTTASRRPRRGCAGPARPGRAAGAPAARPATVPPRASGTSRQQPGRDRRLQRVRRLVGRRARCATRTSASPPEPRRATPVQVQGGLEDREAGGQHLGQVEAGLRDRGELGERGVGLPRAGGSRSDARRSRCARRAITTAATEASRPADAAAPPARHPRAARLRGPRPPAASRARRSGPAAPRTGPRRPSRSLREPRWRRDLVAGPDDRDRAARPRRRESSVGPSTSGVNE